MENRRQNKMSKKNLKRFGAITLAATMALGSAMTVFAEGGDTPAAAAGVAEGTGSYEGGEMKYPTLSVTLPTIPAGTIDYIADPNGLIEATDEAKYSGATFTGNGIFFLTDDSNASALKYTDKSKAQELTNQNAQDIDVTVKLEQKTAGSNIIQYADSSTFTDTSDKANKLYLAITDGAASDPNEAALSASSAAVVTTRVPGVPANYKAGYDATTDKYEYVKKDAGDLTDWQKCSFMLTGAINKHATWGDDVTFPEIKVTWSYKEHTDAYADATAVSSSSKTLNLTMPEGTTVSKVELTLNGGSPIVLTNGNQYSLSGTTLTFGSYASSWAGGTITITYSDSHTDTVTCE